MPCETGVKKGPKVLLLSWNWDINTISSFILNWHLESASQVADNLHELSLLTSRLTGSIYCHLGRVDIKPRRYISSLCTVSLCLIWEHSPSYTWNRRWQPGDCRHHYKHDLKECVHNRGQNSMSLDWYFNRIMSILKFQWNFNYDLQKQNIGVKTWAQLWGWSSFLFHSSQWTWVIVDFK